MGRKNTINIKLNISAIKRFTNKYSLQSKVLCMVQFTLLLKGLEKYLYNVNPQAELNITLTSFWVTANMNVRSNVTVN